MILFLAVLLAGAAPDCVAGESPQAHICRALAASRDGDSDGAAAEFEKAAQASTTDAERAKALAAAGNLWIAANQQGKAALALDRALAGAGLQGEQRGEALLDRARAAEAQNDLKTARARADEAVQTIGDDPFFWYFSAALAIREEDKARAQASIARALSLSPNDPSILFEAGHVAHFAGDEAGARRYWAEAEKRDSGGPLAKAASAAIAMLGQPAKTP
jgi:tetratricopeptide (TPR) repeat protein